MTKKYSNRYAIPPVTRDRHRLSTTPRVIVQLEPHGSGDQILPV